MYTDLLLLTYQEMIFFWLLDKIYVLNNSLSKCDIMQINSISKFCDWLAIAPYWFLGPRASLCRQYVHIILGIYMHSLLKFHILNISIFTEANTSMWSLLAFQV